MELIRKASENLLKNNLEVKEGENLTIVVDKTTIKIGKSLFEAAVNLNLDPVLIQIKERKRHGEEPPLQVREALKNCNVFILATKYSLTHTQARKVAIDNYARGCSMPSINERLFLKALLNVNYKKVKEFTENFSKKFEKVKKIFVKTKKGTSIEFSVENRSFILDTGIYNKPKLFGNIPAGEIFIAPVEGSANGKIIVDGSIASIGKIKEVVEIKFNNGIGEIISKNRTSKKLKKILDSVNSLQAYNLAEFGIGTNIYIKNIFGNVLFDEKVYNTVHFALGDNSTFGGNVKVGIHIDCVVKNPEIIAK